MTKDEVLRMLTETRPYSHEEGFPVNVSQALENDGLTCAYATETWDKRGLIVFKGAIEEFVMMLERTPIAEVLPDFKLGIRSTDLSAAFRAELIEHGWTPPVPILTVTACWHTHNVTADCEHDVFRFRGESSDAVLIDLKPFGWKRAA